MGKLSKAEVPSLPPELPEGRGTKRPRHDGFGFNAKALPQQSNHLESTKVKEKDQTYHPYPPTPWNANPRDIYGTPGPYEDAVQNTPIFEENGPDKFKGIDIMRAVRSFDPCLPCGVHMYLGNGKVLETSHSPMFGIPHK